MVIKLFRLKPSYYLAIFLLLIHGGALACLWVIPWPWWTKLLLSCACLMSFIALFRQHVLLINPHSIIEFWQRNNSHWQLRDNLAQIKTAKLTNNSICTRYFVLLNFKPTHQAVHSSPISILVLSDSLNSQDFRRLKSQLRSLS